MCVINAQMHVRHLSEALYTDILVHLFLTCTIFNFYKGVCEKRINNNNNCKYIIYLYLYIYFMLSYMQHEYMVES